MALLNKEQYIKRKNCLLKAHQWFGIDFIKSDLSENYDVYIDDERALFYVFNKGVV